MEILLQGRRSSLSLSRLVELLCTRGKLCLTPSTMANFNLTSLISKTQHVKYSSHGNAAIGSLCSLSVHDFRGRRSHVTLSCEQNMITIFSLFKGKFFGTRRGWGGSEITLLLSSDVRESRVIVGYQVIWVKIAFVRMWWLNLVFDAVILRKLFSGPQSE